MPMMLSDGTKRGTKRKRVDNEEEGAGAGRIAAKMFHGVKEVKKAAKRVKMFETQKLVKKIKGSRTQKNEDDSLVFELEEELQMIKHIDHEQIAITALKTKLKKDHSLWQNPQVQNAIASLLFTNLLSPAEAGTSLAKVQSRLLSSKVLANAAATVLENLKHVTQPDAGVGKHPKQSDIDEDEDDNVSGPERTARHAVNVPGSFGHDGDEEEEEQEQEQFEGFGNADIEDISGLSDFGVGQSDHSGVSDENPASDDVDPSELSDTSSTDQRPGPSPRHNLQGNSAKIQSQSTFLPSLSVGFIRGDSDSEFSDSEALPEGAERKNRRGQRARRAIWEKKFGRNANHVKSRGPNANAKGSVRVRPQSDQGAKKASFTSRRLGAPTTTRPKSSSRTSAQSDTGPPQRGVQSERPHRSDAGWKDRPPPHEERALHPSWEAKKKLKQKERAGIVAPQGNKIKF